MYMILEIEAKVLEVLECFCEQPWIQPLHHKQRTKLLNWSIPIPSNWAISASLGGGADSGSDNEDIDAADVGVTTMCGWRFSPYTKNNFTNEKWNSEIFQFQIQ